MQIKRNVPNSSFWNSKGSEEDRFIENYNGDVSDNKSERLCNGQIYYRQDAKYIEFTELYKWCHEESSGSGEWKKLVLSAVLTKIITRYVNCDILQNILLKNFQFFFFFFGSVINSFF